MISRRKQIETDRIQRLFWLSGKVHYLRAAEAAAFPPFRLRAEFDHERA